MTKDTKDKIVRDLATVEPLIGSYGMLDGAVCKICKRQLDAKWLRWFTCNTSDGDCLGARARRLLRGYRARKLAGKK